MELIDRNEVRYIESDIDVYTEDWNDDYERGFCDAINKVLELHTIEAEPVRHGRWIEESTNEYYCSYCGKYAPIEKNMRHSDCSNWCKECGARMNSTNTNVGGKGVVDNG